MNYGSEKLDCKHPSLFNLNTELKRRCNLLSFFSYKKKFIELFAIYRTATAKGDLSTHNLSFATILLKKTRDKTLYRLY